MAKKLNPQLSPENYIRQRARTLPLYECLINPDWESNKMANIVITRHHSNGNFTMGFYMVDLLCRGVKDTFYIFNESESKYNEIKEEVTIDEGWIPIDYTLAHNIIYAGIEFADDFGFKPHKDFIQVTRFILEEDNDDIELMEIECGHDGFHAVTVFGENREEAERLIRIMQKIDHPEGFLVLDMINDQVIPGEEYFEDNEEEYDDDFEEDYPVFTIEELELQLIDFFNSLTYENEEEKKADADQIIQNYQSVFHLIEDDKNNAPNEELIMRVFEIGRRFYLNHIGIPNVIESFLSISQFFKSIDFVDERNDFLINGGKKIMPAYLDMIIEEIEYVLQNDNVSTDRNNKSIQKFPDVPFFYYTKLLHQFLDVDISVDKKMAEVEYRFEGYWLNKLIRQTLEMKLDDEIAVFEAIKKGMLVTEIDGLNPQISFKEFSILVYIMNHYFKMKEDDLSMYIVNRLVGIYINLHNDVEDLMDLADLVSFYRISCELLGIDLSKSVI
jgi:hypothetical protein